jgi:hypothetical protein
MTRRLASSGDGPALAIRDQLLPLVRESGVLEVQCDSVRRITFGTDDWVIEHWTLFNDLSPEEAASPGYRHALERQHTVVGPDLGTQRVARRCEGAEHPLCRWRRLAGHWLCSRLLGGRGARAIMVAHSRTAGWELCRGPLVTAGSRLLPLRARAWRLAAIATSCGTAAISPCETGQTCYPLLVETRSRAD